ncbi:MAG: pyrroline-5-carboxylate reductase [Gammaproteobacteria bacterium]|nr:pyrroline-5-carboxylate reductase [Gammaproteobacteria bacterium]
MNKTKLTFIGGGNMASSLIGGLIADHLDPASITVSDTNPDVLARLQERYGVHIAADNVEAATEADVIVLAVKPQVLHAVCTGLAGLLQTRAALVVSVVAGVRCEDISRWLGDGSAVVRSMPNTPALVQTGATALYANAAVSENQRDLAESILRTAGLTLWVDDEAQMDAVTALSGSGPAYFFRIMESMAAAGIELGLSTETAHLLTLQTALGAAKMALESSEPVAELRRRVTSPGGTTEQGLRVMDEHNIDALFSQVLKAAHDRSRELAKLLGEAR